MKPLLVVMVVVMGLFGFLRASGKEKAGRAENVATADPHRLETHVKALVSTPGPRHYANAQALASASDYILESFRELGIEASFQTFEVHGRTYRNVVAHVGKRDGDRVVFGAHYDVAGEGPGADDNASGVAGLIELGRMLKGARLDRRVDLVAYCLEEPPFFGSSQMGSAVHAASLKREKARVRLMMSLEMIGFFSDEPGSQRFPFEAMSRLYPDEGDFIAVAGDLGSIGVVNRVKRLMSRNDGIEVESIAAPRSVPGIDLSDHRSYWEEGFPAVMLTDTAFYRNPNYHGPTDTIDTLDFRRMAEVVNSMREVAIAY